MRGLQVERDREGKLRAAPTSLSTHSSPAVSFDDVLGDGKPQAGAARFARTRGIHAVEALENSLLVGQRNSDAGVGDGDHRFAVAGVRRSPESARLAACTGWHCRADSAARRAAKSASPRTAGSSGGNSISRVICFAAGFQQRGFRAGLDQFHQPHGEKFHFQLSGLDAREFQQIVGQPRQARSAWSRMISRKRRLLLGSSSAPAKQRFRESLNGGERRLEFVRDVGDEILAHALQAAQFGDVVQHHHGAGRLFRRAPRAAVAGSFQRFHRSGGGGKTLRLDDPHGDIALQPFLAAQRAANQPQQFGIAHAFRSAARPSVLAPLRLRISEKARLENTSRSCASITATPSTMLRRMALERLRSPLSERIVRSMAPAV